MGRRMAFMAQDPNCYFIPPEAGNQLATHGERMVRPLDFRRRESRASERLGGAREGPAEPDPSE